MNMIQYFQEENLPKHLPNIPFHRGMLNKTFYEKINEEIKKFDVDLMKEMPLNILFIYIYVL